MYSLCWASIFLFDFRCSVLLIFFFLAPYRSAYNLSFLDDQANVPVRVRVREGETFEMCYNCGKSLNGKKWG